jgi:hypothetical protein
MLEKPPSNVWPPIDLNDAPNKRVREVDTALNEFGDWIRLNSTTWLVWTDFSPEAITGGGKVAIVVNRRDAVARGQRDQLLAPEDEQRLAGHEQPAGSRPHQRGEGGLEILLVMKRKRVGRICDWSPSQSFAALGITVAPCGAEGTASDAARNGSPFRLSICPKTPPPLTSKSW